MSTWTDITSYSQSENDPRAPRSCDQSVNFVTSDLRIVVTRIRGLEGWYFAVPAMGISQRSIDAQDLAAAQSESLTIVQAKLKAWLDGIDLARRVDKISRHPEVGDSIVDNDPRTRKDGKPERVGVVHALGLDEVKVHWPLTNRFNMIKFSRIHDDGNPRRSGYTLIRKT